MKARFVVHKDEGIQSKLFNHFGMAPAFVLVDAKTKETVMMRNSGLQHLHLMCNRVSAMGGNEVKAVLAGRIGMGGGVMKPNAMEVKLPVASGGASARRRVNVYEVRARTMKKRHQEKKVSFYDDPVELRKSLSKFLKALISNQNTPVAQAILDTIVEKIQFANMILCLPKSYQLTVIHEYSVSYRGGSRSWHQTCFV